MTYIILIRYGELALKGNNREYFEKKLGDNVKKAVKSAYLDGSVERVRGRIILKVNKESKKENQSETENRTKNLQIKKQITQVLSNVSGITSFSFAYECDYNLEDDEKNFQNITRKFDEHLLESIKRKIKEKNQNKEEPKIPFKFRATATRLVKTGMDSRELQQKLGSHIWTKMEGNLKVDLQDYDFQIEVEILKKAYIFSSYDHYKGKAGLPLGTQGSILCLFFPGKTEKCAKAAVELMRRGTIPIMIASNTVSEDSKEDSKEIQKALDEIHINAPGFNIKLITTDQDILEFANNFAESRDIRAISVPDTVEDIKTYKTNLLVLRPLIVNREKIKSEITH